MTTPENEGFSSQISLRELLQVRERVKGERLPLFVIKSNEQNERISRMWRIPGTSVRVSPEGDIYYPVWRERVRVNKSELYAPCSNLPAGWSFERLLASRRRPISEVVFYQVKKNGGSVEAAIRSMDHVLENYVDQGKETEQVKKVKSQINQAIKVLQETKGVGKEEFEEGFDNLYRQTLKLMEDLGMKRASSALKKDVDRLLTFASTGRDKLGRKNQLVVLQRLEAVEKRVEYRLNEIEFVKGKFLVNKTGLLVQREKDREILAEAVHQFTSGLAGHVAFEKGETTDLQKGILLRVVSNLIYQLGQVRVKPYKPVAVEIIGQLVLAREEMKKGNYQVAKGIFDQASERAKKVLDEFTLPQDVRP